MHRILAIVALFVLFNLLISSALAGTQLPINQSEPSNEKANIKNVVSLTTTDLLNTQDFAPQVSDLPAKRGRLVNAAKGGNNAKPLELSEGKGKKGLKSTGDNQSEAAVALAGVMRPTALPAIFQTDTNSSLPVRNEPQTSGIGSSSLGELVQQSARRHGVDQRLILAVMQQESSFNPRATSYKGARGLMQLMPATASRFGVTDIYDPAQNIEGGARYLRFLLDTFNGDVELALAGYNAGEHAVSRYGNRIPPYRETQDYVRKISAHYERLTKREPVRGAALTATTKTKKPEAGFITVGSTMTQY